MHSSSGLVAHEIKTYDEKEIINWAQQRQQILKSIAEETNHIRLRTEHRQSIQTQLDSTNSLIAPLSAEIKAINSQIFIIDASLEIKNHEQEILEPQNALMSLRPKLQSIYDELKPIQILEDKIKILETMQQIAELQKVNAQHQGESEEHEKAARSYDRQIEAQRTKLSSLDMQLSRLHTVGDLLQDAEISRLRQAREEASAEISRLRRLHDEQINLVSSHGLKRDKAYNEIRSLHSVLFGFSRQLQNEAKRENLDQLTDQLHHCSQRKELLLQQKIQTVYEIEGNETRLANIRKKINTKKISIQSARQDLASFSDIENTQDKTELQSRLQLVSRKKLPLEAQANEMSGQIRIISAAITSSESMIQNLKGQQRKLQSNSFLVSFFEKPQQLILSLRKDVANMIDAFNVDFATQQSKTVRKCLAELKYKIPFILAQYEHQLSHLHARYYRLTGLLWTMLDRLKGEENQELSRNLLALLNQVPLDPMTCRRYYIEFQNANLVKLHDLSDLELNTLEAENFSAAEANFRKVLEEEYKPDISKSVKVADAYHKGIALADRIIANKNTTPKKDEPEFDIKYNTTVLEKSTQLARESHHKITQQQTKLLAAQDEAGKPSVGKKIGGLLLAFVGVAVAIGSVIATALSFGASTPSSVLGIKVGTTMAAKGVAIASTATGVVGFLGGCGLFASGKRKGVSKDIHEFVKAVEQVPERRKQSTVSGLGLYSAAPAYQEDVNGRSTGIELPYEPFSPSAPLLGV